MPGTISIVQRYVDDILESYSVILHATRLSEDIFRFGNSRSHTAHISMLLKLFLGQYDRQAFRQSHMVGHQVQTHPISQICSSNG
ncbi:hypothetical protein TNCV_1766611 [Trichonephila clavipes]|nr:hypothetical protein TNCV_1766611 [Trichonephila clavipes]